MKISFNIHYIDCMAFKSNNNFIIIVVVVVGNINDFLLATTERKKQQKGNHSQIERTLACADS